MNSRMLIFIPCYNCEKQIARVISKIDERFTPYVSEIIVLDNQSTDNSVRVAREALEKVAHIPWKILRNNENYNLGGSHKVAFNYALDNGFSHVVVLHGDDQSDIRDLLPELAAKQHEENDSLLGSRFMRGSQRFGYSTFRTIGNYGLNAIASLMVGQRISDQGSGLNVYRTEYLAPRFFMSFDNGMTFPNMMFFYGQYVRSRFRFFPITWREEDQTSHAKAVSQALRVLRIVRRRKATFGNLQPPERTDYPFTVVHEASA